MMKFVAMAAMVAAAPTSEDYLIDLDMLQGGADAGDQKYVFPQGTKITITAIENRSWGYAWDIKNECGNRFQLVDDSYGYEHANGETEQLALGRRGRRTLIFETASANTNAVQGLPCEMTFTNKRPWLEEPDSPDQVKKITVTVGELMNNE